MLSVFLLQLVYIAAHSLFTDLGTAGLSWVEMLQYRKEINFDRMLQHRSDPVHSFYILIIND